MTQASVARTRDPAPPRSDFKFGDGVTFNSSVGFDIGISPDKKAFTARFSGLEVRLEPKSATPVDARVFSFSLPVADAARGAEIPFFVQGFALCEDGANAHLVFIVNDQTTFVDFPGGSDTSFLHQVKFTTGSASEVRITAVVAVDRDSKSEAAAHLNISSIDTDVAKHPPPSR
jgi:hypothetical protein